MHHHHHHRHEEAYNQVINDDHHKAKLSHELIAGAAAYEAMKAYHAHVAKNGQPASHEKAKELLAAFGGAFIDRMIETKGLDFVDSQKARHAAQQHYNSTTWPQ